MPDTRPGYLAQCHLLALPVTSLFHQALVTMLQKQMEGLVCEIRVHLKNEEYRIYTERFNKEYLKYIYLKLDETEADMSQA